jgi:sugar lactone lactonase YvrE
LIILLAVLSGCATPPAAPPETAPTTIVWPEPPLPPRIRHVRDIQLSRDIQPTAGFWNRLKEIFAGKTSIEMVRAYGLAIADQENLIIADPGSGRIHIFHLTDGHYRSLPHKKESVELISPIGVGHDGRGRIFVSDSAANVVHVFDPQGRLEQSFGEFLRPTGLVVNHELARLYVVDTAAHRIRVYTPEGVHLFDIGERGTGPGAFNFPTNIALDRAGNIYVTDSMNFRVQVLDEAGRFLRTFGRAGDGPGSFSKPRGIGVDGEGHIYVVDATFDNVQIFDASGQTLLYFGGPGRSAGHFYLPAGLAIDDRNRIFVADSYNHRVQIFQYLPAPVAPPEPEPLPAPAPLLGIGQGRDSAIVMEKSTRTLSYFTRAGQEIERVASYPFSAGKKASETFPRALGNIPEGVFYVTEKRAFGPDGRVELLLEHFPLAPGAQASRTMFLMGSGGEPPATLASAAADLLYISAPAFVTEHWNEIAPSQTPFVVMDRLVFGPPSSLAQERAEIYEMINEWKRCWDRLDLDCYIGHYASAFRHDNMDLAGWKAYKRAIFSEKRESLVTLRERHVIKIGGHVVLNFFQDYRSPDYRDLGTKQIVLRREGNRWRIITEKWSPYEDQ